MGVDIVGRDGPRSFTAGAGIIAVVPAGAWHRVYSAEGMVVASATIPGGHVDLDIADPRPHLPPQGDRDDKPPSLIDLGAELAKVTMYRRSPHSTAADRKGSVAQLDTYRDGLLLAIKASGKDHWERHATGDELVCVVDGAATLEMVCDSGPPRSFALGAGTVGVIPQGAWHRFQSAEGFTQIAVTPFPGETVERDVDDPRGVESRVI
jgi:mannose-6-phosphate isomerase-like protein (cupin superfamily)